MTALALLHGGGQGSWVWDEALAALSRNAPDLPVIALDVPGCGVKRGRDLVSLTVEDIADELNAELAGHDDVVLVGHSLAGSLLPRMAERATTPFRKLVYLSCTAAKPSWTYLDQMGKGLHGDSDEAVGWPVDPATHSLEQRYRAMFCNDMDTEQADAFLVRLGSDMWPMDVMRRTDWRYDHLDDVPSTFVVCEQDMSLPANWQRRFAERFRCKRITSIDAGHQAMNTQPAHVAEMLLKEI